MLEDFLGFIKERKTVALDELAAHFGLRTQVTAALILQSRVLTSPSNKCACE